jgi:arginine/ornithine N-succinyltransferase beta subunit
LWPLRVQGAVSAEQAGLVRCYLRDLAQRDATDLMAVAGQHGHSLTALPALRPVRRRISWTILSYFD